jgi:hypothetical protein
MVWGDMEIKDIIKSDDDRLFIVDPECYIIFTGETTDDIKPFIRIGNWNDMPVELIPLIENIIITDSLIGNPAHEQFNIDVRHLPENRYIGSRAIVRKFLDYQKIFGLDLTNASVVDIEKDLPELSKEKNISHKDQFIGVFYRNGDFKTLLNKNTIFDLNKIIEKPISWQKFHDLLSETYKNIGRYDGSGLVVIGHNPMFYHKKSFYTYLFPNNYLRDFSLLGIDPGKIQAILHPSLNLINISKLFKWLNNTSRKVRIFSNSIDIDLVKKLFAHSMIRNDDFSDLNYITETGLAIKNYPGTYNLKLEYDSIAPHGEELTTAFIKGSAGIRTILKEKLDALIVSYTAYEDVHMLLKSTSAPCAIIDDGNKNISKLAGENRIILSPGIHYEFRKYRDLDEIIGLAGIGDDITARITGAPEALSAELASISDTDMGPERRKELYNLLSLIRAHLLNTRDRRLASQLRNMIETLSLRLGRSGIIHDRSRSIVVLALFNGSLFPFIIESGQRAAIQLFDGIYREQVDADMPASTGLREYYKRILSDRERLQHLIDIYTQSEKYHLKNMPELNKLKEAIHARKDQYREESLSLDNSWSRSIATAAADAVTEQSGEIKTGRASALAGKIRSMPMAVKISIPLIMALIIAAIIYLLYDFRTVERFVSRYWGPAPQSGDRHPAHPSAQSGGQSPEAQSRERGPVVQSLELDNRYSRMSKQMNILIKDHDIFEYANRVAVKNGYHRIATTKLRERNPDWIYPENVFIMLDGQRVVVSRGDTLWNLSKNKLIESTIKFDDIMKQLNAADIQNKPRLINEARQHAFTSEQQEIFRKAMETIPLNKRQGAAQ